MPCALVVEGDKTYRDLLVYSLGLRGWMSIGVSEYAETVAIIDKQTVDVVIVDILAPSMEDFKLIKGIRERSQSLPIVVLSVSEKRAFAVEALVAGATDIVLKPVTLSGLEARLAAVLDRARGAQSSSDRLPARSGQQRQF